MKFLIIQTAFAGDVILATPVIEKLHQHYPEAVIDFLLRKGNEDILKGNPCLNKLIVWDKKHSKYRHLWHIIRQIRKNKYDYVINLQRFFSTGMITVLSGAKKTVGFDKNPLSFLFSSSVKHQIPSVQSKDFNRIGSPSQPAGADGCLSRTASREGKVKHETERNLELIKEITDNEFTMPKLHPCESDYQYVERFKTTDYMCIAPTSVWFTKQFTKEKWLEFLRKTDRDLEVYLLGGKDDSDACEVILNQSEHHKIQNVAGKLSFLQTAALMKDAKMNYVNDSAPLHIASSMNAPVTAIFCSTIPAFGFGPLSDNSKVIETKLDLDCRPCGLHGLKRCPEEHFKCATSIEIKNLF